ncbi:hypothetical protein GF389_06220 [Candidatus Dojkabacteria bacterium]|nr:hypothetical protein [Candidatus Dojkabacteria bacterium]
MRKRITFKVLIIVSVSVFVLTAGIFGWQLYGDHGTSDKCSDMLSSSQIQGTWTEEDDNIKRIVFSKDTFYIVGLFQSGITRGSWEYKLDGYVYLKFFNNEEEVKTMIEDIEREGLSGNKYNNLNVGNMSLEVKVTSDAKNCSLSNLVLTINELQYKKSEYIDWFAPNSEDQGLVDKLTVSWEGTENAALYSLNIYPADCDAEEAGEFGCGAGYIEETKETNITIDWPEFEKVGVIVSALNENDEAIKVYDEMVFEK